MSKFKQRIQASKKNWEKDFPLAKLIFEGIKSIRGQKKEPVQERPLTYEEWQFKKRREAGFMY